jgi:hypothetical protein
LLNYENNVNDTTQNYPEKPRHKQKETDKELTFNLAEILEVKSLTDRSASIKSLCTPKLISVKYSYQPLLLGSDTVRNSGASFQSNSSVSAKQEKQNKEKEWLTPLFRGV